MRNDEVQGNEANWQIGDESLNFWIKKSGKEPPRFCPEITCTKKPEMGVFCQLGNSDNNGWFIIPLCKTHASERIKTLIVFDGSILVPVEDVKNEKNV